jgi:hypothetical protein
MFTMVAALSTLSATLILVDVPEMEPYDDDEITETFDRLQGYPSRHHAEQRKNKQPNPLGLVGVLIKRLPKRQPPDRPQQVDSDE